jgi:hypothetical protein
MTPAQIHDVALLELLGDLLRPDIDPSATGAMRLRLMQQGFSWQALVDLARGQGVLLPLIFALSARGLLPPVPRSIRHSDYHVTARLGTMFRQHLARRELEKRQLDSVLLRLARAGIAPLILKGARYLVEPVAPWCEARPMADFDILVRAGDAERAFAALTDEGYRQMASSHFKPELSHHLPAIEHPDQPLPIELHIRSLARAGDKIMSTEHVWAQAIRPAGVSYFVLPAKWHALHGLLHHQIQDRGHVQRVLNVKALWEWTMLASTFASDDWDVIWTHMRAAGASDVLDSWLFQAHRMFGLKLTHFPTVSATARAHASASFGLASRPYWIRRIRFIAGQLRVSFARDTLALKYGVLPSRVSLLHCGKNLIDLLRGHRGKVLARLTGSRDRLG